MYFEIDGEGSVKGQALLPTATGPSGIPMANLYVAFIHGGQVVAQTQTDARGNFTLKFCISPDPQSHHHAIDGLAMFCDLAEGPFQGGAQVFS